VNEEVPGSPSELSAYDILGVSPDSGTSLSGEQDDPDNEPPLAPEGSSQIEAAPEGSSDGGGELQEPSIAEVDPVLSANNGTSLGSGGSSEAELDSDDGTDADSAEIETIPAEDIEDEATARPLEEPTSEAADLSDDESILMAEIMRLLTERDSLYEEILSLQAENAELVARLAEDDYYKERAEELEREMAGLSAIIEEKEADLVAANTRLGEIEARLLEQDAQLLKTETRLAALSGDGAQTDAALAAKDELLKELDEELRARDATITEKDSTIESINSRLALAEASLEKAKADLATAAAPVPRPEGSDPTAPVDAETASAAIASAERRIAAISAERDAALMDRAAAEKARLAAEASRAEAEAALSAALASGVVVSTTAEAPAGEARIAAEARGATTSGYLSGWKLDTDRFSKKKRSGFDGSSARIGEWKISGVTASQTDASQFFSRLELPLAQDKSSTLYRFKARSTGKGWIGLGIHLFVEDVRKKRGYGEGRSLLVWFTRDRASRGDDATYLQLYRSDDDVVMERMLDAELQDGIGEWRLVEIVYDPGAEYIAVSVDGVLRIVYKTFFGRDSGATVSLRTLGGGASFSDFSAWTE